MTASSATVHLEAAANSLEHVARFVRTARIAVVKAGRPEVARQIDAVLVETTSDGRLETTIDGIRAGLARIADEERRHG